MRIFVVENIQFVPQLFSISPILFTMIYLKILMRNAKYIITAYLFAFYNIICFPIYIFFIKNLYFKSICNLLIIVIEKYFSFFTIKIIIPQYAKVKPLGCRHKSKIMLLTNLFLLFPN